MNRYAWLTAPSRTALLRKAATFGCPMRSSQTQRCVIARVSVARTAARDARSPRPHGLRHLGGRRRAVHDEHALRLLGGDGEEPFADALVEVESLRLEPVGPLTRRARETDGRFDVEQDRQVRRETAGRPLVERPYAHEVESAAEALVRDRRVGEAVADDDPPACRAGRMTRSTSSARLAS